MKKRRSLIKLGLSLVMMLGFAFMVPISVNAEDTTKSVEVNDENGLRDYLSDTSVSDIILLNKITLQSPLTIEREVAIHGKDNNPNTCLVASDEIEGNFITIKNAQNVELNNIYIETGKKIRNGIHIYNAKGIILNGIHIIHNSEGEGAPIVINNHSEVRMEGQSGLLFDDNAWYGINVDDSVLDIDGFIEIPVISGTQSVICAENGGYVTENSEFQNLSEVTTVNDGGNNITQKAYVDAQNFVDFVNGKGSKVTDILLRSNINVATTLKISSEVYLSGLPGSYQIIGTEALGDDNVVTVMQDGELYMNNVEIVTDSINKSCLHIYGGKAVINDVLFDNTETIGGAGVVVNGGELKFEGENGAGANIKFKLGKNSWGAINLDNKINDEAPILTMSKGTVIDVKSEDNKIGFYYTDDSYEGKLDVEIPKGITITLNNTDVTISEDGTIELITVRMRIFVDGKEIDPGIDLVVETNKGSTLSDTDFEDIKFLAAEFEKQGYSLGVFLDEKGTQKLEPNVPFYEDFTIYMIIEKIGDEPTPEMKKFTMYAIVDGKTYSAKDLGLEENDLVFEFSEGESLSEEDIKILEKNLDKFNFEGYRFKGFFLDDKGTQKLPTNKPFNEDFNIYMIWEKEVVVEPTPEPEPEPTPEIKPEPTPEEKPETKPQPTPNTDEPKTSDNANIALYASIGITAILGAGILVLTKKKKN